MTKIMPFPENNNETVLLDRPFEGAFLSREFVKTSQIKKIALDS